MKPVLPLLILSLSGLAAGLSAEEPPKNVGTLQLQAPETVFAIGGRVTLDTLFNSASLNANKAGTYQSCDILLCGSSIAMDGEGEENELLMTARNSRFWFKTRTPTPYAPLRTLLEVDFWETAKANEQKVNAHNIRLRHAYGEIGPLLFGQASSAFSGAGNPELLSNHMDFFVVRQAQVRWTHALPGQKWFFSLENPESVLSDTAGVKKDVDDDRLPDLVAGYGRDGEWGRGELALLFRQVRHSEDAVAGTSDAATGAAFHFSGRVRTAGRNNLRFALASGNVMGRYLGIAVFNDAAVDDRGELELWQATGGHLAYQHWWNGKLRSTFSLSAIAGETPEALPETTSKRLEAVHANLYWSPFPRALAAIEMIQAKRTLENDDSGTLNRVHGRLSFDF